MCIAEIKTMMSNFSLCPQLYQSVLMNRSAKTLKSQMEMSAFTLKEIISPGHFKQDVGIV